MATSSSPAASAAERELVVGERELLVTRVFDAPRRLVFKAHPAASVQASALGADAARRGLDVVVHTDPQLAETWFGHPEDGVLWRKEGSNVVAIEIARDGAGARAGAVLGPRLPGDGGCGVRARRLLSDAFHGHSEK